MERGSIEKMGAKFIEINRRFEEMYQVPFVIPEEALRERKNGSMQVATFRFNWVFGEVDGCEYLEFYRFHRFGDEHTRIWEDRRTEDLDTLETMYGFNPDIPGDKERKEKEMMECYERVLNDLAGAGLLGEVPHHTMMNTYLVLRDGEEE